MINFVNTGIKFAGKFIFDIILYHNESLMTLRNKSNLIQFCNSMWLFMKSVFLVCWRFNDIYGGKRDKLNRQRETVSLHFQFTESYIKTVETVKIDNFNFLLSIFYINISTKY